MENTFYFYLATNLYRNIWKVPNKTCTNIQLRVDSPSGTFTMDVVNDSITLVAHISVKDDPNAEK